MIPQEFTIFIWLPTNIKRVPTMAWGPELFSPWFSSPITKKCCQELFSIEFRFNFFFFFFDILQWFSMVHQSLFFLSQFLISTSYYIFLLSKLDKVLVHAISQLIIEILSKLANGRNMLNTPLLVRSEKLNNVGLVSTLLGDYLGTPDTVGI